MQLHQLQPKTIRKTAKRIGRGGKRGKTSGRGHKGQKQHGGHGIRPEMRDVIKKIPKLRGHGVKRSHTVNNERKLPEVINVSVLEASFEAGDTVSPASLVANEVLSAKKGKMPQVKILGNGEITKKLTVSGCVYSASAKEKIEKVGGKII